MGSNLINQLDELQAHSGKSLPSPIIHGFKEHVAARGESPLQLIKPVFISNANWTTELRGGVESLRKPNNRQAVRRVMTLTPGQEHNFTYRLNTMLLGGENYPVLTAMLGTVAGLVSMGAGLIFTVATTALSLSRTSQRVLARSGDEIWQVEEVGKIQSGVDYKLVHVSSYFIVDPFRSRANAKGWLIHEERQEVRLS